MRQGNGQDNGAGWIDTHVHMDDARFADAHAVRRAARAAGVARLVIPAIGPVNFHTVRDLAQEWGDAYALGIHPMYLPHDVDAALAALEAALEQCRNDPHLVAIGEIGLDFYEPHLCTPAMRVIQENCFAAQLRLAQRFDLPVILHSRRTHDKLAMHLKRHDLPRAGVVHGFSGSQQQAERFVQLGYKIGVGGTITYPRASKTRDVIAKLPLASLLLETDAPDMPLNGFQGQPNRPEQAARVFTTLCELRKEPEEVIADVLLENTRSVFGITL